MLTNTTKAKLYNIILRTLQSEATEVEGAIAICDYNFDNVTDTIVEKIESSNILIENDN